jgi:hypothetical protein
MEPQALTVLDHADPEAIEARAVSRATNSFLHRAAILDSLAPIE